MSEVIQSAISRHRRAIQGLAQKVDLLAKIAQALHIAILNNRQIFVCGNGGSAADAQHIAAEFIGRFKKKSRPPIAAIALTTDTSALTAIANDFGWEKVFSRQIEGLARPKDIVWVLSTSGRSHNILEAMRAARAIGAYTIGFTGISPPQEFFDMSDWCFRADGEDTASIQESHQIAYHAIIGAVEESL